MHAVAMHLVSWTSEGKPTSVGKEPEPELHGRPWQAEWLPSAPPASPSSQGPRISREPVGATDQAGVKDAPMTRRQIRGRRAPATPRDCRGPVRSRTPGTAARCWDPA
jgi:hypothetical protein